ncbi:Hypothetical protein AKI40_2520 [Enterobacter sp. FY-07]|nr:Hypothetical protein AKI40_2520 [Enterobacter sp. FY-07]
MNIYIMSSNIYLRYGVVALAKLKGWKTIAYDLNNFHVEELTCDDMVILHVDVKNSYYARAISSINQKSKLLVLLEGTRDIVIGDADNVIKSRESLSSIIEAINFTIKKEKKYRTTSSMLSDIENIILNESLKGSSINLIANALNLSPKKVYAYRTRACKKLGGKKINDLLLIREKLLEDSCTRLPSRSKAEQLGCNL